MDNLEQLTAALADRYRIERELGAGGMATVYLAEDLRHQRHVAIKVLRPELAAVIGAERFLSEIRTTANLQHPNILPLFDSGNAASFLFYVMPFIEGESLRDRLEREKQLPVDDAVRIATEVGGALDYAHRHNTIHRDIKPENILLHDGRALVADFGIALAASRAGGSRMTETGMSLGTPSYMSPEQAMGEREITARSDVYALGAMTYEMLVGDPPFTGSTAQAVVAKVLTEKPAPPSSFRDTVSEDVDDAVLTALAKLPADRWPTAAAFVEALGGGITVARPRVSTTVRPRPRPAAGRSRFLWPAATVVLALVAVSGWWSARPKALPIVRFEVQAAPGGRFAVPIGGVATQVTVSPDGRLVVFAGSREGGGWRLYIRNLGQLLPRALPGTDGAYDPDFSPDGRWIAFRSPDGKLKKIAIDGTSLTTLCSVEVSNAAGGGNTWLSDRELVFAKEGHGLFRVSSDGGEPSPFSSLDSATGERLQLSPRAGDGGRLVFYSSTIASNADLTIGVIRTATGKPTILTGLRVARVVGLVRGTLVYVRGDGALMAVPFDTRRLKAGVPLQIGDSVAVPSSTWDAPVSLSASGTLAYQLGGIASQLVRVDEHGGGVQVLIDSAQMYSHPRLSPDGRSVAVEVQGAAGADIWTSSLSGHTSVRLTRGSYNNRPEWSPDGARIMYTSTRDPQNALWWQPADGSAEPALIYHDSTDPIREGVFAPNGGIAFRVDTYDHNRDIYLLPPSGDRKPVPLLTSVDDDKEPRISPDGKWLAWISNASGREEVYVRPLLGGGSRVPVSTDGGGEPLWSRDGRRIFYRKQQQLIAATIATSPALSVTSREVLFDTPFASDLYHPNYDVMPDGRSFVMVRPVESDRHLVVTLNWIEELRQRTGGR